MHLPLPFSCAMELFIIGHIDLKDQLAQISPEQEVVKLQLAQLRPEQELLKDHLAQLGPEHEG